MTVLIALGLPLAALGVLLGTALAIAGRALRRRAARQRAAAGVTRIPRSLRAEPDRSVVPPSGRPDDIAAHAARGLESLERWRRSGAA